MYFNCLCVRNKILKKIDSIHPFESDNFNVSVTIKGNSYRALLDTGAAVRAISSQVWDKYL